MASIIIKLVDPRACLAGGRGARARLILNVMAIMATVLVAAVVARSL